MLAYYFYIFFFPLLLSCLIGIRMRAGCLHNALGIKLSTALNLNIFQP